MSRRSDSDGNDSTTTPAPTSDYPTSDNALSDPGTSKSPSTTDQSPAVTGLPPKPPVDKAEGFGAVPDADEMNEWMNKYGRHGCTC